MSRLLHDRYVEYSDTHAWDLATGERVTIDGLRAADEPSGPIVEPLAEVIEHGREGEPRSLVVAIGPGESPVAVARRVADQARARGLVPLAADVYLRFAAQLADDLRLRTLMILQLPAVEPAMGARALLAAAAVSARPHVLVSIVPVHGRAARAQPSRVREARTVYRAGTRAAPILEEEVHRQLARADRWRVLCSAGRHAAAVRLLRDVAASIARRQALVPAAGTLVVLGRLLLERGRAAAAGAAFDEASAYAQQAGDDAAAASARVWQAAAKTDAAELSAAESLCRAALLSGALAAGEQVRTRATLARVLLWQGRIDEAAECGLGAPAGDDAFAAATAARVLVARGDLFAAGAAARALLDHPRVMADPTGRVIALAAHARVLLAAGDPVAAEQALEVLRVAARDARSPLRLTRLRLLYAAALRRWGRTKEAEAVMRRLRRVGRAAPPLLQRAILELGHAPPSGAGAQAAIPQAAAVAAMVAMARDEERDREAVVRVLAYAADLLRCSRMDVWSAEAGPDTAIASHGSGMVTTVGPRVLDAGIVVDGRGSGGAEIGVPVRLGTRLVAALVARWPADRSAPPHAAQLLEVTAAVAAARVDAVHAQAREEVRAAQAIPELVGSSGAIADVRRAVARAAAAPFSVLIEGESGSGKELVARALHQMSPRRDRRFCDLNCAALPDELIESELFGHVRGAFTGALTDRAGLVEDADGGTLFLDEVADLSPRAQAKLLRVLQQQEVRRVGATFSRKVDVRIVSAANRDLRQEAADGRFRQDLLYRLDVVRIRVPPLRERPEDVATLARHFWAAAAARVGSRAVPTHGLLAALSRYHWPGNVRELQNVIAGLAVAAPARGQVSAALLPVVITGAAAARASTLAAAREQFERRFIEVALARAGGRRARAARDLGMSRQGLLKLMARLGLT